jgi:SAM-dependent methyltransferase
MTLSLPCRFVALLASALLAAAPAAAQRDAFEPQVGQPGKDVIWVPTPDDLVERMLHMAQVTAKDYVVDLGAGDGRIAIAAAKKFGARSLGIEYNPDMVKLSQKNAQAAGVAGKATFRQADIFVVDFSQADVITMYLLPDLNLKLRPKILSMRPGTRVVSHAFNMDDWEPDEVTNLDGKTAYFWLVPASVPGTWALETSSSATGERLELGIEQRYQRISGRVSLGQSSVGLRDARLRGSHIEFSFVDARGTRRDYAGQVSGGRMEGTYRSDNGSQGRWTAVKK